MNRADDDSFLPVMVRRIEWHKSLTLLGMRRMLFDSTVAKRNLPVPNAKQHAVDRDMLKSEIDFSDFLLRFGGLLSDHMPLAREWMSSRVIKTRP